MLFQSELNDDQEKLKTFIRKATSGNPLLGQPIEVSDEDEPPLSSSSGSDSNSKFTDNSFDNDLREDSIQAVKVQEDSVTTPPLSSNEINESD